MAEERLEALGDVRPFTRHITRPAQLPGTLRLAVDHANVSAPKNAAHGNALLPGSQLILPSRAAYIVFWCCSFDSCAGPSILVSLSLKMGRKCSEAARCSFYSSPLLLSLASIPPLRCRKFSGAAPASSHLQKSLNRSGARVTRSRAMRAELHKRHCCQPIDLTQISLSWSSNCYRFDTIGVIKST